SALPAALESDIMPPWPPAADCNELKYDRSLEPEHKQQIIDWVEAGAREGDASASAQVVAPTERAELARIDHSLSLETGYTPTRYPDDYRCFVFEWPEEETTFVSGYQIVPDQVDQVHHLLAYLAPASSRDHYQALDDAEEGPGYTCFGGTEGPLSAGLGGWAPGSGAALMPADTGIEIPPGSLVILQMHYNTLFVEPKPDRTAFNVQIDYSVEREAIIQPWINPDWLDGDNMAIPAGQKSVSHSFSFIPGPFWSRITGGKIPDDSDVEIHSALHHMHLLGKSAKFQVIRASGDDCLLEIPDWDFDWQDTYMFKEPIRLGANDLLQIECEWDNSPENQPDLGDGPQPPRDLAWGEGSTDEMCFGTIMITRAVD
ncbi:MAG: monooxygenase, partial [Deltaproteobacteria bacterium]|nr:monooxygenase [Deltaproteobacteria bacterium]